MPFRQYRSAFGRALAGAGCLWLGGCENGQSVLAPSSDISSQTALLSIILLIGACAIFIVVMAFIAAAALGGPELRKLLARPATVFCGGVVFPAVTLTALLSYGVYLIKAEAPSEDAPFEIAVEGEQWWWRVSYPGTEAGSRIESANEIRVPVGRPVRIRLTTADVIHSFWVPQLAGKVDMIPGRTNVLQFRPTAAGIFRGQCAEYCGGAHALMGLSAVALEAGDFAAWLERERGPAREPQSDAEQQGQELFMTRGCPACHAVRGTQAVGTIGPNLTHVGSRNAIAAQRLLHASGETVALLRIGLHHLNRGAAGQIRAHRADGSAKTQTSRSGQHGQEHHDRNDPGHRPRHPTGGQQAMARGGGAATIAPGHQAPPCGRGG